MAGSKMDSGKMAKLLTDHDKEQKKADQIEAQIAALNAKLSPIFARVVSIRKEMNALTSESVKSVKGGTKKRKPGLRKKILEVCQEPKSKAELLECIKEHAPTSLSVALSGMKREGKLEQPADGKYRTVAEPAKKAAAKK